MMNGGRRTRQFFEHHRMARSVVASILVTFILGLALWTGSFSHNKARAVFQSPPATSSRQVAIQGSGNYFPYGQCTWWANQRYHQLHGIYVPWTTNSDAWQWNMRAYDFHWTVSDSPTIGAIVDLQPWVQGAGGLGHVAVVESILGDGSVVASNMNWGSNPLQVTYVEFFPGPGVAFITA